MSLSHRQHTVLLLLVVVIALRLAGQGRLQTAWATLWGSAPAAAPQPSTNDSPIIKEPPKTLIR